MRAKIISAALIVILLISCLPSCGKRIATPENIVAALCDGELSLPRGRLYLSDASEGSDGYLPPEMLSVVYGFPEGFNGVRSAAIWLSSSTHPCEFAVFLCVDGNSARDVALFCRGRLDTLEVNAAKSAAFCGMKIENYLSYVSSARVVISGRYVALMISSDPRAAEKIFLSAI